MPQQAVFDEEAVTLGLVGKRRREPKPENRFLSVLMENDAILFPDLATNKRK
jgi:hypothetical protein